MRMPYSESVTVFPANVTPETVLPEAMEPIDMPMRCTAWDYETSSRSSASHHVPWPPEQVLSSNTMVEPELMAMQSSWFLTTIQDQNHEGCPLREINAHLPEFAILTLDAETSNP